MQRLLQEEIKENLSPFVKRILTAGDGEEGLALFHAHEQEIDLIITDISMPKLNGIEMVDTIRKTNFEVPVIYTTAFNDSEHLQRTVSQSVDAYIIKPIDFEALLQGIHKASLKVENQRLKSELTELIKARLRVSPDIELVPPFSLRRESGKTSLIEIKK